MDVPINAKVECKDGPFGRSTHIVLKATNEEVTHLVVSEPGLAGIEYLVPIQQVVEASADSIRLACTHEELQKMPVFRRAEFIPPVWNGYGMGSYVMWPYAVPEIVLTTPIEEQLPADELAVRRGASVFATDGQVGHVDEFLINPKNDRITHLVLREGHLWGQKDVSIPLGQIEHIEADSVYLKLDKAQIEALPAIPIHRNRGEKP